MIRLILLALLAFMAARLLDAAAPASFLSIISVPVVSRAHTSAQLDARDQISISCTDVPEILRLPTVVTPSHYDITITPYFDTGDDFAFTFQGKVRITVRAQEQDVQQIVLHSEDLAITSITVIADESNEDESNDEDSVKSDVDIMTDFCEIKSCSVIVLNLNTVMSDQHNYVITASYSGIIRDDMRGFYKSWYFDDRELRWMGVTHLQPSHARKVFPSFDEPKFKAEFTLTIDRPEGYSDVLSNMPIKDRYEGTDSNGVERQTFHTTPKMSTYLLSFVISHYKSQQATEEFNSRPFGVYARTSADQDGQYAFDIGKKILVAMEDITGLCYYTMADHMKMDLVAIPDHADGAMENYGLLAFREPLILSREGTTSDYYKQRIIGMISHEVAHMWYGNLVTCEWWDYLWLNEGFARYYEMFLAHEVVPNMGFDVRFVTEHMFNALYSDSLSSTQPLTSVPQELSTPLNDYDPHSSVIVYSKGASIIRQTEHLLGEKSFKAGLTNYLTKNARSTATPEELWEHLQNAVPKSEALADDIDVLTYDIDVAEYFITWSTQPGFPLLTVDVSGNTISICQSKFNDLQETEAQWIIPITYATASEADFLNTKPSHVMKKPSMKIEKLSSDDEWVLLNKQATGFYRVNYDAASWDRILEVLSGSDRETIHPINRAQIVNDVFALAMFDIMPYDRALKLISWLEYEKDFAPWAAAIDSLDYLRQRVLSMKDVLTALDEHVIKLASTLVDIIGFEEAENEDFMLSFTRLTVVPYLCRADHAVCIATAVTKFTQFKQDSKPVSPNSRPWVYCNALRHGTVDDFDFLWNLYLAEEVSNEKEVILEALGCTPHRESILALLNHITSYTVDSEDSIHAVRIQDTLTAFNAVLSSNTQNAVYAFEWFMNHWQDLAARLQIPTLAFYFFGRNLHHEETIDEYEIWVNSQIWDSYHTAAHDSAKYARTNLNWIRTPERLEALIRFFYVTSETTPDTTPDTTSTLINTETTTLDPNESNSSQGIFACIMSVSVTILFQIVMLK